MLPWRDHAAEAETIVLSADVLSPAPPHSTGVTVHPWPVPSWLPDDTPPVPTCTTTLKEGCYALECTPIDATPLDTTFRGTMRVEHRLALIRMS